MLTAPYIMNSSRIRGKIKMSPSKIRDNPLSHACAHVVAWHVPLLHGAYFLGIAIGSSLILQVHHNGLLLQADYIDDMYTSIAAAI